MAKEIKFKDGNNDIFIRRQYTFLVQNSLGPVVMRTLRANFKVSIAKGDEDVVIVEEKKS